MTAQKPIQLVPASTSSTDRLKQPRLNLPAALVDKAVTRLCAVSIIAALSAVIFYAMNGWLQPEVADVQKLPMVRLVTLLMVLASGAFLAMHRSGIFSKQMILHLGIVFQIVVAFLIAMSETSVPFRTSEVARGVSSVALWTVFCGLMIPGTPTLKLLASLSSAFTWPAAYFLSARLYGHEWIGWSRLLAWSLPLLVTAVLSYLIQRRIYRIEVDSRKVEDLGSYTLASLLGRGGMGEVWRAHHRILARDAAVKIIRPEVLASQSIRDASMVRKRFEREAQATARLRSPHTVALYDFGMARDNSFYYVMELLDGVDLQTMVERYGPMPPGRVVSIIIQACESLEEAHRYGMVHRDIKPRNLLLCKLGLQYDFVKVLDFGLVKVNDLQDSTTQMSMDGTATGTPAYMAPEIALGKPDIDGRSDLYGLGCVAYFLLTGELVFDEPSPMASALAHIQKPPVPPSQRTEIPIPASLEQVIMQCLEKDPENRPASAWELARRLERLNDIPRFCRDLAEKWWNTHLPVAEISTEGTPDPSPVAAGSPVRSLG